MLEMFMVLQSASIAASAAATAAANAAIAAAVTSNNSSAAVSTISNTEVFIGLGIFVGLVAVTVLVIYLLERNL